MVSTTRVGACVPIASLRTSSQRRSGLDPANEGKGNGPRSGLWSSISEIIILRYLSSTEISIKGRHPMRRNGAGFLYRQADGHLLCVSCPPITSCNLRRTNLKVAARSRRKSNAASTSEIIISRQSSCTTCRSNGKQSFYRIGISCWTDKSRKQINSRQIGR